MCTLAVTLTLEIWPWVKVKTHPLVTDNNCVKYYPTWKWGVMPRTRIFSMCALWLWPWGLHTLGSQTAIVRKFYLYLDPTLQRGVMARKQILVCVHCDLDLGDLTLGQGHETPFGNGQQLCEMLSRSNMAVRSYDPTTDFWYDCTVTLTLEIWPCQETNCGMCALWPLPWRHRLCSRSWHTLRSWTIVVWNII